MSNVATETNRTITVLSPRGAPEKALSLPNGIKWSELKKEVEKHYSLDKMKAVESIGSHTLEHPNAIVPDGDFDLYLLQLRSKSGAKAVKKAAKAAKKAAPKKAAKAAKKEVVAKKATTKSAPKKAAKATVDTKPARSPRKKAEVVPEPEPVPVKTLAERQRAARELARGFDGLADSNGGF